MVAPSAVRRRPSSQIATPALALLALVALPLGLAHAAGGAWSPAVNWSNSTTNAVHLVLSPGDGVTHHSRLLWFRGENQTTFGGGEWNWNPGFDGCDVFPNSRFSATTPPIGLSGMDLFCTGHAARITRSRRRGRCAARRHSGVG